MSDLGTVLRREVQDVHPQQDALERTLERARRIQRSRRAGTIALALAVAAAGIVGALIAFERRAEAPSPAAPKIESLELAWQATYDTGGLTPVAAVQEQNVVAVSTAAGLYAWAKDCGTEGRTCEPLWTAQTAGYPSPAAADGVIYEAGERGLLAFAADCGSGGESCAPLWVGVLPEKAYPSSPVVSEDVVMIPYGIGTMPEHRGYVAAFRTDCADGGEACEPLWTAFVGTGTSQVPPTVVADQFFQQVGDSLVGFDIRCGIGGAECEPSFVWSTGGEHVLGPEEAAGELLVTSSDGSVYAFPKRCPSLPCRPLWTGPTGGHLDGRPLIAGDRVVVTQGDTVHAFPLGCRSDGGVCEPAWTARVEGAEYVPVRAANARIVVAGDIKHGDSIWAFPADCRRRCEPAWEASVGDRVITVRLIGDVVVVGTEGGKLLAYPVSCSGACDPVWSAQVQGKVAEILYDESGLYVVWQRSPRDLVGEAGFEGFESGGGITAFR